MPICKTQTAQMLRNIWWANASSCTHCDHNTTLLGSMEPSMSKRLMWNFTDSHSDLYVHYRMLTFIISSASQSWNWQLIGMS